jgi:heptosyltransferase I
VNPVHLSAPPESILVIRLGAMGDIIHTLAAVTALRTAVPDIRIGWVVEDRWSELLCAEGSAHAGPRDAQRPIADFLHLVDTKRWRKSPSSAETRRAVKAVRHEIRDQKYEVAADFQGAMKSALIARFSGATAVAGFEHPREAPARFLYRERFPVRGTHVIEHYRSLAEAIAARSLPKCSPSLPRDEKAETSIAAKLAIIGQEFVLINPGAGWGAKQWPAERYGKVARAIASEGFTALVNFGPGEQELALSVQEASGGVAQPISCSIAELIALTHRAKMFIGGDTGPLHLAAALRIPVVAIFGPTDPARNGPYSTNSIVLRHPASKTSLSHTSTAESGLLNISADEVISAARKLREMTSA